jgi:acyl carrier protein
MKNYFNDYKYHEGQKINKIKKIIKNYPGVKKFKVNIISSPARSFNDTDTMKILMWVNQDKFDAQQSMNELSNKKTLQEKIKKIAKNISYKIIFDIYKQ